MMAIRILTTEETQIQQVRAACADLTPGTRRHRRDLCRDADRRMTIIVEVRALYTELRAAKDRLGARATD
jgi:hypothetical protein